MLTAIRNNRSLTFYQQPTVERVELSPAYAGGILSTSTATLLLTTEVQTGAIHGAVQQLRMGVISRGLQYAKNTIATKGGLMAENWVSGTYNFDAVIKKSLTRAAVPASQKAASPDVIISDTEKTAGLKFYADAKSSAKAQSNPAYEGQTLIIPKDQLEDAKKELAKLVTKNEAKGRTEAAQIQKNAKARLTDKLTGPDGVESTPLSKKDDLALAKAISKDKVIDEGKFDLVLKKNGIFQKRDNAILKNELRGLGIAVAIGAGVGLTIGFVASLAQSGITPESLRLATIEGAKGGVEAGVMSAVGYGLGRSLGEMATKAATGLIENLGINITENLAQMVNMGVAGTLTIIVFSAYQFTKLKLSGIATRDALMQTGKQALFSLSLLAVSIAAQGIWGGAAGIIVSISFGIIFIGYSVSFSVHQRHFAEKIRLYTIEKCRPVFSV